MPKPKLTISDFEAAAKKLRCSVADIQTVEEVESKGAAFYSDGFPVILFERHKFHLFTKGEFDKSHAEISHPKSGGYGRAGKNQRRKFNLAFALNPIAAMKSCSWGKFQIMGFNHELCGFSTVGAFVDAMKESEAAQLHAFVNFILNTGLADELRNHKWERFVESYNGADYKKNNYHIKLPAAYKKFSNHSLSTEPAANPRGNLLQKPANDSVETVAPADVRPVEINETDKNEGAAQNSNPPTTELCKERPSAFVRLWTAIVAGVGSVTALGVNIQALFEKATEAITARQIVWMVFGLIIVGIALWFYDRSAKRANVINQQKMAIASNPALVNVELNANKGREPYVWMSAKLPKQPKQPLSITEK